jgi:hypothetical protein
MVVEKSSTRSPAKLPVESSPAFRRSVIPDSPNCYTHAWRENPRCRRHSWEAIPGTGATGHRRPEPFLIFSSQCSETGTFLA